MMRSSLFYIANTISRIATRLLVRSDILGDENLPQYNQKDPKQRAYFILENNRSSHRHLLLRAARQQDYLLSDQQILSQEPSAEDSEEIGLHDLMATLASNPDITVNLYPVAIFHGRLPSREKSWLKLIFSESWNNSLWLSYALQLLFNGRQTLIHIGKPLPLNPLVDAQATSDHIKQKTLRIVRTHFQHLRSSVIGPDLSHRRTLISLVLKSPDVQNAIDLQAARNNTDRDKIERHCQKLLNDIAANFSPTITRVLDGLFNIVWKKLYTNIQVNNIESVQQIAPTHQLIYLPCHRSHMDYLLLSWALYRQGLMLPHVAAGDNLNMPIIGPILKRAGAIFMRRRFQGDDLYRSLYKAYLQQMSHRGHSLEYFIEGGRSRTGRLLPPKTGLLSMSIETHIQEPEHPVAIVPIWISYDRLVESQSFQHELSGKSKPKETLGTFLRTLKILKEDYGEAQLSFGQPIALSEHIDPTHSLKANVNKLASQIMQGINSATYINTSSMLATCLLSTSEPFHKKKLEDQVKQIQQLLIRLNDINQITLPTTCTTQWITDAETRKQLQIQGNDILLSRSQKQELCFYRNNIQPILILPALTLLLAYRLPNTSVQRMNKIMRTLYPFLQAELFLPISDNKLTPVLKKIREALILQGLLERNGNHYSSRLKHSLIATLALTGESVVLRYYIVIRTLFHYKELTEEDLLDTYRDITGKLHHQFGYVSSDYSDKTVLMTFISQLGKQELIVKRNNRFSLNFNSESLFKESQYVLRASLTELIDQHLGITKPAFSAKK